MAPQWLVSRTVSAPDVSKARNTAIRLSFVAGVATVVFCLIVLALILLSVTQPDATAAAGYLPLAWSAAAVLLVIMVAVAVVKAVDVKVGSGLPILIGVISFLVSFVPWLGVSGVNPDLGTLIYRGLRVAPSTMQFWDLSLVMQSVDCARWGFDIYVDNNGCMQDASIYAPGMVWLQYVPFTIFSQANVALLGLFVMALSSVALFWLARQSTGVGQVVLLVAAVGGPWLLLLERANIDAVVMWTAIVCVIVVRRWSGIKANSKLWPWILAAALLWLMGTWKYYPFVMGVMLIPVFRLRYGWTVIAGYLAASIGFVILTWRNFLFSSSSNEAMIDYGDFVVLGRVPLVSRMIGATADSSTLRLGDVLVVLLVLSAFVWGACIAVTLRSLQVWPAMLAVGGSSLYLASVLIAGFGWGYKAVFILLAVPMVASLTRRKTRLIAASALGVLLLVAVQSAVVWNMVLATSAGLIAAGFSLGVGIASLFMVVLRKSPALPTP